MTKQDTLEIVRETGGPNVYFVKPLKGRSRIALENHFT